jgi:6-phosphogluconolactonase (cycloisomerase 2 family)
MKIGRTGKLRQWVLVGVATVVPVLTGCSNFFVPETTTSGGTGGGGTTGNSVYVANFGRNSLNGFSVVPAVPATAATTTTPAVPATPAALNSITGLPTALGFQPLSMAVTPKNTFLYVGSATGIRVYAINSNGSLTVPSANPIPAGVFAQSMTISPDGQWLIALDGTTQQLDIFLINASTGALTSSTTTPTAVYSIKAGVWSPTSVRISPNGQLIFAALGTGGDAVFTFNTTTGSAVSSGILNMPTTTTSDFGLAIDSKTAYLYIARSGTQGGVAVYSIGVNGALAAVSGSPFAAGSGTYDVVLDSTGTYVYAANRTDGTISGFTIVPGTTTAGLKLTPLSSSPYASGIGVQSLGFDTTGKYLLAAAVGGSPDLTMYEFDATVPGQLDPVTTKATDTDPAGASAVVLTH